MERLNNIMRGTPGPHQVARQRLPQQPTAQGQRPLPEQSGRLSGANRTLGTYRSYSALPPRVPAEQDSTWEDPTPSSPRPLKRTHYGYGSSTPRGSRLPHPTRYVEPPQGDYYEDDERAHVVPADVQDEWSDDTGGMRYGDWESASGYHYTSEYEDEEDYAPPVVRPRDTNPAVRSPSQELSPATERAQRLAQLYGKGDPLATRELYRVSADGASGAVTRDSRDARLPVPAEHPQVAPAQPGPPMPQRTTQPLKPQQVARLHSEMQQRALRTPPQQTLPETPRVSSAEFTITVSSAASTCPICKGAGFLRNDVPFGHPQFGKAIACKCKEQERKRKRRQQLQEISNLGAFASKRFNTFNPRIPGLQEAFQVSTEFAKAPDGWLLLVGPNGCGKTHLAAAIANDCLEKGAVVLFATVPDLLDHLRAAFAPDSTEVFDQLFARMREAELLVLDDLGAQQSSPWANEKLFQLLNYRYNSEFPTVITANPRGLQSTDDRIRSRLSDISLVATVNLERARDYRPNNPHRG
ncbi:MAG TPA: ATP-binding protein [Ktedonobacteraceae bacterium]|nr:ATP-binding protein [Ktedonobacteraceae bacterium]